jgi:hypothetical protein
MWQDVNGGNLVPKPDLTRQDKMNTTRDCLWNETTVWQRPCGPILRQSLERAVAFGSDRGQMAVALSTSIAPGSRSSTAGTPTSAAETQRRTFAFPCVRCENWITRCGPGRRVGRMKIARLSEIAAQEVSSPEGKYHLLRQPISRVIF